MYPSIMDLENPSAKNTQENKLIELMGGFHKWGRPRKASGEVKSILELAAEIEQTKEKSLSPGVLFARKLRQVSYNKKQEARLKILNFFLSEKLGKKPLFLTLPGLYWKFEEDLILHTKRRKAWPTIIAVESDDAIYRGSLKFIPGIKERLEVRIAPKCAKYSIQTEKITRYYHATIEDIIKEKEFKYDAAWLDFTGPLTLDRLNTIIFTWENRIKTLLAITILRARVSALDTWSKTKIPLELQKRLIGSKVIDALAYNDPAPMIQLVFSK